MYKFFAWLSEEKNCATKKEISMTACRAKFFIDLTWIDFSPGLDVADKTWHNDTFSSRPRRSKMLFFASNELWPINSEEPGHILLQVTCSSEDWFVHVEDWSVHVASFQLLRHPAPGQSLYSWSSSTVILYVDNYFPSRLKKRWAISYTYVHHECIQQISFFFSFWQVFGTAPIEDGKMVFWFC